MMISPPRNDPCHFLKHPREIWGVFVLIRVNIPVILSSDEPPLTSFVTGVFLLARGLYRPSPSKSILGQSVRFCGRKKRGKESPFWFWVGLCVNGQ